MNQLCALCGAIENSFTADPKIYNTILLETDSFVVTPCIGPLVMGQLMITSKKHYSNLSSMTVDAITEFQGIVELLVRKFKNGSGYLIAEHGSLEQQTGGGCITHTHLHWIPGHGNFADVFDGVLPQIDIANNLNNLLLVDEPYILTMNNTGTIRVYLAYNAHSQMIRKAICSNTGRSDWDWASNPQDDLVRETINFWRNG